MKIKLYLISSLMILSCIACGDSDDESTTMNEMMGTEALAEPDIIGNYVDNFMTSHVISASSWTQTYEGGAPSVFHVRKVNNESQFLIAENDAMNEYNPSLFSRFDWVTVDDQLWYCQTTFTAESVEDAEATPAADATDPSMSGCGMYAWSALTGQ